MKKRVAARWVAKQAGIPNLKDVLVNLKTLGELSQNIEDVTDTFGMHYKMGAVDTNIASQLDALKKAKQGLKAAQAAQQSVQTILAFYPEDKTALRASKDAQVMVKRFEKHLADATKMIQQLSKKQMPPTLKKVAAAAARMIQAKLVDPKKLVVEPWQKPDGGYSYGGPGHTYLVTFRIDEHQSQGGPAQLTVWENTGQQEGLQMNAGRMGASTVKDAKSVALRFLDMLTGWPGMKGEAEATAGRAATAQAIAAVLKRITDDMGMSWSRHDTTISKDNLTVESGYRSDSLPKEGESEYGWQRYQEMVEDELKRYHAKLDPALRPFKDKIKSIDVHDGEKSNIYTYITLK